MAARTTKTTARKASKAPARRALAADTKATTRKAAPAKKAAPASAEAPVARSFTVSELPAKAKGQFACRSCGEAKPATAFPTISGPDHRGTECRACRNGRRGS